MDQSHNPQLPLTGGRLTLDDVAAVARSGAHVHLAQDARRRMAASRAWVASVARGDLLGDDGEPMPVYGVNTGYGSLARVRLPLDKIRELSLNLVRSHAAGMGEPVEAEVVRAMMLLRANALAKGASGCRPALVDTLCQMLAEDVVPVVPSRGSCGSSGDLAPLSHLGLVLFRGEEEDEASSGMAWHKGVMMSGLQAMAAAGIPRLIPLPKEGLAICNGAQLTTAYAALAVHDASRLALDADIAASMSFEALRGTSRAFHPDVHALRPYPGAMASAAAVRGVTAGSSLADSLPEKVQDAYSLRCVPQVHGAVRDGLRFVRGQVEVELNSATDNPIFLLNDPSSNKAFSAGLFHGEPIGLAADHLRLVLCELAAISERRIYRLATGTLSARLPPLLVQKDRPGLGLLAPQTTAAALVAECRSLAWPAGADSIPTCEDQEDMVAMSTTAARRAWQVLHSARRVIAVEMMSAAKALRWRLENEPSTVLGNGTAAAYDCVVTGQTAGMTPSKRIAFVESLLASGQVLQAVVTAGVPLEVA